MKKTRRTKYTYLLIGAAMLLSACTDIEENLPENTDAADTAPSITEETGTEAVPAIGTLPDNSEETNISETETEEDISDITTDISEEESPDVISQATESEETVISAEHTETEETTDAALPSSIELTFYEITLKKGESKMPIVTMYPEDCEDKSEIWASSDESVAIVDDYGLITAVSEGECTVTVKSAANQKVSAEVKVTVPESSEPSLTYINGILIANKTYALPSDYNPGVDPEAQAAFDKMQDAASEEGLNIWIASGFRSYEYQQGLYERYASRDGYAAADRYSARAGHSEHQTGLAFDLNTIDDSFADTAEGKWVAEHCHEYGFIIRYPKGKESVTGYQYEPWHIRYLGTDIAEDVYSSGLTLEEYLGITSEYSE